MAKFVKDFKNHLRSGIELFSDQIKIENFTFKKIEIKKKSEITEITEKLKIF